MSTLDNENTGADAPTQPASFVDRMIVEYHKLGADLNKLVAFVETETHAGLSADYQHLLQQQISGMSQYLHALAQRLVRHGVGVALPEVGSATTGGACGCCLGDGCDYDGCYGASNCVRDRGCWCGHAGNEPQLPARQPQSVTLAPDWFGR